MSNYTQTTLFGPKDNLPAGDPAKKIRGAEIDVEFGNIATAVNSKADSANPAFSGTATGGLVWANGQTFNAANVFNGPNTFNAANTFNGANTFTATNTFSAANIFSGSNTFRSRLNYASSVGGTENAITLAFDPPFVAYVDGQIFMARAQASNTSDAVTINVDGLGTKSVVKEDNWPLAPGNIAQGHEMILRYNASLDKIVLLNPAAANTPHAVTFTSSGTWVRPPHVRFVRVYAVGGGGGGYAYNNSGVSYAASGGGGGYIRAIVDVRSVSSVPVTVGSGGYGYTTNIPSGSAGNGGSSSFGSFATASGGGGGYYGGGGFGGSFSANNVIHYFGLNGYGGSATESGGVAGGTTFYMYIGEGGNADEGQGYYGNAGIVIIEEF